MKPLDPFQIDLEKSSLIQASAGTGKTYTITTLYCRLVARGYPVESILVVTFTESAAAELKVRIRTRLSTTLAGLTGLSCEGEEELARYFKSQADLPKIRERLQFALTCFDQASIMTIHSFCFKILKENAFESRSLFDIELVPDSAVFLRQVSYDFFMGHVNPLDPLFLSYLNQRQVTPENFIASLGQVVSRSDLVCRPIVDSFESPFDRYRKILEKVHDMLLNRAGEIRQAIFNHNGIDKRSYTQKNVPAWLDASRLKLDQSGANTLFIMAETGDALYKFTQTRLALKTGPGQMPPQHVFFDLCEQLSCFYQVFENNLIHLKIQFLSFFSAALEKMKKDLGICFFDDLVNDLAAALEGQGGNALQNAVRQVYKACLIDEFQDTDPRQYDVFSRLFSSSGTPFFMIGDPKQAIYAFRGGDIFAYLKASRESEQRFTLEKNYRSAPLLVEGINLIFANQKNPFLYGAIEFSRVTTPATAGNSLVEADANVPPLQFCFIKREGQALDKQGFLSKETAGRIIPDAVAADILSLLKSDKQLITRETDGKSRQRISPKDIAVLVRTNLQAEQIQKALSSLNIPSYLSKSGSVFDSRQAIDLHDVLWAVVNPDNKGFINAALCTSVFGFSSDALAGLAKDEAGLFRWQDRFRRYKAIWENSGFVAMIMHLFHSGEAFLKEKTGLDERGLTNFYHLVELISQACLAQHLSPYYLMKWYSRQLFKDLRDEFSDELRLSSDKKAVAIVTIHKSKGLEYPVVYLPYLWEGQRRTAQENIVFHDPEKDYRLTLDFGSGDMEKSQLHFETEEKAEHRRLLYVALTRASAMCRIFWGGFNSVETSALGGLLHENGCKEDHVMVKDLETLQSLADNSILVKPHIRELPGRFVDGKDSRNPALSAVEMTREVHPAWKISSFSAISHTSAPFQGLEKAVSPETNHFITLAQFPKGAGSGDFFHSVFETLDFSGGGKAVQKQVQSASDKFGFLAPDLIQSSVKAVGEILETPLLTGTKRFSLKDIRSDRRFNEMEFTFPVKGFQMSSVIAAFEKSDAKDKAFGYAGNLSHLTAKAFKGFLKGFIDLVIHHKGKWYIIDYKSNYLGDTYDQYSQDAMGAAMAEHHYFLQYHLYLVALHRYLSFRVKDYDYDTHFGGVFYLFIRGMHPESGPTCGVFFDRPAKAAVNCLSDSL